ncbi:MAG: hypothetical protein EOO12_07660 [Chitinophagaceae bacterium]|nr:MAG: hypothetical protein EOO12_07660 [Chitinophagaceae bacterium]
MKKILLVCLFVLPFVVQAQTAVQLLASVHSTNDAERLIARYPRRKPELFHLDSGTDSTALSGALFAKKAGYTFRFEGYWYKLLKKDLFPEFHVSYIYLDGSQLPLARIDSLRQVIMNRYRTGTPFAELAAGYTMDGNSTGVLGWRREGTLVKEFETAVRQHRRGDLFTVDLPERNWYYVVLNTDDERSGSVLTFFRIKEE